MLYVVTSDFSICIDIHGNDAIDISLAVNIFLKVTQAIVITANIYDATRQALAAAYLHICGQQSLKQFLWFLFDNVLVTYWISSLSTWFTQTFCFF